MKASYTLARKQFKKKFKESLQIQIPEGTKVKLNYDKIISDINYPRMRRRWKEFIESAKGKIWTVEYDKKFGTQPEIVMLKEDVTEPKYYFWVGDLEVIKQGEAEDGK